MTISADESSQSFTFRFLSSCCMAFSASLALSPVVRSCRQNDEEIRSDCVSVSVPVSNCVSVSVPVSTCVFRRAFCIVYLHSDPLDVYIHLSTCVFVCASCIPLAISPTVEFTTKARLQSWWQNKEFYNEEKGQSTNECYFCEQKFSRKEDCYGLI